MSTKYAELMRIASQIISVASPADFEYTKKLIEAADEIERQEPVFMWHRGATAEESEVVDVDCACPCCVPLYAHPQPVLDASALVEALEELVDLMQGVIDGDYVPDCLTLQPATAALAAHRKQGVKHDNQD